MKTCRTLHWNPRKTPALLRKALVALADEYPLKTDGAAAVSMEFVQDKAREGHAIQWRDNIATITYSQTKDALRAVGTLLANAPASGVAQTESGGFETMGIMLDCSRNAVMRVDHFERWLRRLALMGYNQAMLYTEETYALPGEDYFGFVRGRYTPAELRRIDTYAAKLGIEMVGCIQTLGHLANLLRWPAYSNVRDTASVMMVGEKATYDLIEKMIANFAKVYRSRRIHIGMDETHDLGRGRYMDRHGYRRGYDLFNEHLTAVVDICKRHGLQPMIWSDMYFRMGSRTMNYYDMESKIPGDVKKAIPSEAQLVYWDYYHDDEAFYSEWIKRHRNLGHEPVVGSGVWTWGMPWYGRKQTENTVIPCVNACRKMGVKEIFYTLWGDDGAYCDFDSSLAGLLFAAELSCTGETPAKVLDAKMRAICQADYGEQVRPNALGIPARTSRLLWDDPLLGVYYHQLRAESPGAWQRYAREYAQLARDIRPGGATLPGGGDLRHAKCLAEFLAAKLTLIHTLRRAYAAGKRKNLEALRPEVRRLARLSRGLGKSFRQNWFARNKPFGWEALQVRLAGQEARFKELDTRLAAYLSKREDRLLEFEEKTPRQTVKA